MLGFGDTALAAFFDTTLAAAAAVTPSAWPSGLVLWIGAWAALYFTLHLLMPLVPLYGSPAHR